MGVRDLPGYNPTVADGGLGATDNPPAERLGVAGVSCGAPTAITRLRSVDDAIDALMRGSGLEQVLAMFANGSREVVYAEISAADSTAADAGTPVLTGTGDASAAVSGTPYRNRDYIVEVLTAGAVGTATYRISSNNGKDYSEERKFLQTNVGSPKKSRLYLEAAADGYYVEFTGDTTAAFAVGDVWVWSSRELVPTAAHALEAIESLMKYRDEAMRPVGLKGNHIIYLAQRADAAMQAEILELVTQYWDDLAQTWDVLANAPACAGAEGSYDILTWVNALVTAAETLRMVTIPENDYQPGRLGLVPIDFLMDTDDGGRHLCPGGGVVAGLIASAQHVHYSIGWPREFKCRGVHGIYPYNDAADMVGDWDDVNGYVTALSNAGHYITARYKPGFGIVLTDDWMMAPLGSDYFCLRYRRIMDKAVNQVRDANFLYINSPGTTSEDMLAYQKALEEPLRAMKDADEEITAFRLTLTPADDVASSGDVNATLDLVPTFTKKRLNITFRLKRAV